MKVWLGRQPCTPPPLLLCALTLAFQNSSTAADGVAEKTAELSCLSIDVLQVQLRRLKQELASRRNAKDNADEEGLEDAAAVRAALSWRRTKRRNDESSFLTAARILERMETHKQRGQLSEVLELAKPLVLGLQAECGPFSTDISERQGPGLI